MKSKYLQFDEQLSNRKTRRFEVINRQKNVIMSTQYKVYGYIEWHSRWRQYCFFPNNVVLSRGCMDDINNFIEELMNEKKLTHES